MSLLTDFALSEAPLEEPEAVLLQLVKVKAIAVVETRNTLVSRELFFIKE